MSEIFPGAGEDAAKDGFMLREYDRMKQETMPYWNRAVDEEGGNDGAELYLRRAEVQAEARGLDAAGFRRLMDMVRADNMDLFQLAATERLYSLSPVHSRPALESLWQKIKGETYER